jgi:predicted DNA binding CopG/RHH family protein
MRKYKLPSDEQRILDDFYNDTLISSVTSAEDKTIASIAAYNFAKKAERINIRLKHQDLNHIKRIAAEEGMPYQTLISSVLHKYAAGYLKLAK